MFVGCYNSGINSVFYPEKYVPVITQPDLLYTGCAESVSQCIENCAGESFDSCQTTQFLNNSNTQGNSSGNLAIC